MDDKERAVALVTGGAVRLGRAISRRLARDGCGILVHYHRSGQAAEDLVKQIEAKGGKAWSVRADLQRPEEIVRLFQELDKLAGRLDYLVNNAALFDRTPFVEVMPSALGALWKLNVRAPFLCCQQAAGRMKERGGSIVNLLDIAAKRALPKTSNYCMTKASLEALTRCLSLELAPKIRVNAVAPGIIYGPDDFKESAAVAMRSRIPMGRYGKEDEVADTVLFLLRGPEFINGQILAVDGGRSARL